MKKLFLVLLISMLSIGSYAQNISINVRMHGGNERLYFGNSHAWMQSHGYHYHQGGYYIGHNRRIYPNRREYYNPTNNRIVGAINDMVIETVKNSITIIIE